MIMSPTSGPVGTVVTLSGNAGSSCYGKPGLTGLEFEPENPSSAAGTGIYPSIAANGSWSVRFVIPPYVGTQAMTRSPVGADVTPGAWQFVAPGPCNGSSSLVTEPFTVTGTFASQPASRFVGIATTPQGHGYWLAQAGGGVYSYGSARFYGSLPGLGITPAAPIVGIAATPDAKGYWLLGADGGVFAFGDAGFYGSAA